ncbi:LysE family transporter [Psychromonas sp. KJ10-2]|uniref:LysE family transporter n=1 Tax=Psychromonas sp. KJ10-2 TaxID=3391822 RepID=UPI0039B61CD2
MEVSLVTTFVTVVFMHFIALISPGPDFIILVKSAIKNEKEKAIGVALGISIANALYIGLCLVGVGAILAKSFIIMMVLKILGGLFLIYLGVRALSARKSDYPHFSEPIHSTNSEAQFYKEFVVGFMSGVLNPKNILFYLSLFTLVLTPDISLAFNIILGVWMTLLVFIWDVGVIYCLSGSKVRSQFIKLTYYFDKITGALLGGLGVTIIKAALQKID